MNFRASEIEQLNIGTRWLDKIHASNAYVFGANFISNKSLGLNKYSVSLIIKHKIESTFVASNWMKKHFPNDGTVQVIFSEKEVLVMSTSHFLNRWLDIFVTSRDDAIIIHNNSNTVLFYCHEDWIEIGQRNIE